MASLDSVKGVTRSAVWLLCGGKTGNWDPSFVGVPGRRPGVHLLTAVSPGVPARRGLERSRACGAMASPEAWRKTGRKAAEAHWVGLSPGELVEIVVYNDQGQTQGTILVELLREYEDPAHEGRSWLGKIHACQDDYFAWWVSTTYDQGEAGIHFCGRRGDHCSVRTPFRDVLHVDVFRMLPGDSALSLPWLSEDQKNLVTQLLKASGPPPPGSGQVPGAGAGEPGGRGKVEGGEPGIRGLAAALAGGERESDAGEVENEPKEKKTKKRKAGREKDEDYGQGLQEKIAKRSPPNVGASALRLKLKKKKASKKKKNKDKKKTSSSSESSDRSDSLFQLAALPAGTEKIHRLHEERPGTLANLTLLKFQEILERTVGLSRGTAENPQEESLPPVARGYLTQILLTRFPEAAAGLRNVRELRTLAAIIDGICQNDSMRSLDVAVQRFKSIELFMSQGSWEQGNLLELIPSEGEARSYFRPELKATQQELKTEQRLRAGPWQPRRNQWAPRWEDRQAPHAEAVDPGGAEAGKDEKPPSNRPGQKGRKGKGKGKGRKGKFAW